MSSQSESKLPEFLQNFSPISLHYRKPISHRHPWVFWSEYEGCENNSTSADVGTPINIHDKIISALSNIQLLWGFVAQFWAPVTIGGRRLLSTSAQPFAAWPLSNKLAKYRLNSEKYKYTIDDANQLAIEPKQMIKSGGPATAFLNRRTSITKLQRFLAEFDDYWRLSFTLMLPIGLPSQSICIGVLEFTFVHPYCPLANLIYDTVKAIKDVGLDVFYVQHLIPYKTINGLKLAKDHIEKALKVVCESHDLALAQVWIPYEDKTRVFLPSSLEDTQTKQLLAIKFTGCYYTMKDGAFNHFGRYFRFSDVTPRAIGEEFPLVTLQDHLSRYIPKVRSDMVMCWGLSMFPPTSALAICLRSNDTNDCNYVFEFMWKKDSNFIHLEALLLTLKRCLPRFKFASGVEIGQQSQLYSDMSSQSNISKFLQTFSPICLHYRKPISYRHPWVFWSEYEGSEHNSSSADVGTPIIYDKIKYALSNIYCYWWLLAQFWAPVTIGGRRLLSTSAQPFAVSSLFNEQAKYRLNSDKYKYTIDDANQLAIEPEQMIKSGGPATAFLNRRTYMTKLPGFLSESDDYGGLDFSVMIPICFPSQSNCIGVLELTLDRSEGLLAYIIFRTVKAIKKAGLDVFYVQDLIPYNNINGLKLAKDHIAEALKVVCESHDLALAQVWIPYEDKTRVFFPSFLEDTQTKQLLAIKLTGCNYTMKDGALDHFEPYFIFSDVAPRAIGEEFPLVTLQDYKSRYISKLHSDMVMWWGVLGFPPTSALAICLRSNDTNDCNYVFEFMWYKDSNFIHLEALLLTLKRCLPRFKFASGVEIGNEIDIHTEHDGTKKFKLFQGNGSMAVDYTAHSEVTCKTTPKVLPQEVIEKQFGNAMKDAAKNLNEWPGPSFLKRNKNDSSIIQINTNEEDNGAVEDTSAVNLNKNVLTVNSDMSSPPESDSELLESKLPEFLQIFSSVSLHYKKPESDYHPWVFWSKYEGSENNSSSAHADTPIIHDKIKSALSGIYLDRCRNLLGQFWAPVTIGDRMLLSTSAQPFSVNELSNQLAKCRLNSEKYKYNIDENKPHIEPDHNMIKSGGPATAFLNCRTSITKLQGFLSESDDYDGLNFSVMIPICFPSQSICIGVLEFTFHDSEHELARFLFYTIKEIKDAGLDVFYVQHLIPYKTINGLKVIKDEIEEALKDVCESHNLALAQVWIPYYDKNDEPFSYFLKDIQTKRLLAIKLTGYLYAVTQDDFEPYFSFGDVTPRAVGEELPFVSLQDHESRYISKLHTDMIVDWDNQLSPTSAFAICLKSNDTADFNYMFEFIWPKCSDYVICLEKILLTLKRCLPRFKFASGAELGDELEVILIDSFADGEIGETQKFKIFEEKRSSPMPKAPEKQKKVTFVDLIAPSKVMCKTAPKNLSREVIQNQFGKTMKDAAKSLKVSVSTLKRKSRKHGILEWQGPNFLKRNKNDSSIIQFNTNEEDNGAIEDTSTVSLNKNELTIKAEYKGDITKFHLLISQATFVHVEKEIGKRLELSDKTYKLKYLDEDGDWINLKSDEEMTDCIKSSRKSNRIVVRMRVLPSRQPVSGPAGS